MLKNPSYAGVLGYGRDGPDNSAQLRAAVLPFLRGSPVTDREAQPVLSYPQHV
jgi:hypothetical protein